MFNNLLELHMTQMRDGHIQLLSEDHLDDVWLGERVLLKWVFRKVFMRVGTGFIWHKVGTFGGLL